MNPLDSNLNTQNRHTVLVVGGKFDRSGGKASGVVRQLAEQLALNPQLHVKPINGGGWEQLTKIAQSKLDAQALVWMPDVSNDETKLLPAILKQNPGLLLVQSKYNDGKYSDLDLAKRMQASGAEMLIECKRQRITEVHFRLHTQGINTIALGDDIKMLAMYLGASMLRYFALHSPLDVQDTKTVHKDFIPSSDALKNKQLLIPCSTHPGAFGVTRKNHIHEGIDLYCTEGSKVFNMQSGIIAFIRPFTGEFAQSPWWNNTWCVGVRSFGGVINYGEIQPKEGLQIGQKVKAGEELGHVIPVLKEDKGRPQTMLHIERYASSATAPVKEWALEQDQPSTLLDPTVWIQIATRNSVSTKYGRKKNPEIESIGQQLEVSQNP